MEKVILLMNYWAIISLISSVPNFLLGFYVLYKDHKRNLNVTFALFAFSVAIWCFSEFGHRIAIEADEANLWIRFGGFGWCFMVSFWIHFVLIFAKKEKWLKKKVSYIFVYAPSIIILYMFLTTDLIYEQEAVKKSFGYTAMPGKLMWVYTSYYMLMFILMIYLLLEVVRKGTLLEKRQSKPVFIGSTTFLLLSTLTNIISPAFRTQIPELGTTFSMIWVLSIYYAVRKYKLFTVEPSVEDSAGIPKRYVLEKGYSYLIREEAPDIGYNVFYDQITHGNFGLCVSKFDPELIREKYSIIKTPILWSTFKNIENAIMPKNINGLLSIITDFVKKTENSMIFFDCFDQLRFANGFSKLISFFMELKAICSDHKSIILISLNPAMFNDQQFADIERELEEVKIND